MLIDFAALRAVEGRILARFGATLTNHFQDFRIY